MRRHLDTCRGPVREWAALRPVDIKFAIRIFCFRGCPSSVLWGGPRPDIAPPPHHRRYLSTANTNYTTLRPEGEVEVQAHTRNKEERPSDVGSNVFLFQTNVSSFHSQRLRGQVGCRIEDALPVVVAML